MEPEKVEKALKRLRLMMGWDLSEDDVEEVKELFTELDGWFSQGGPLPDAWQSCMQCERCRNTKPHGEVRGV